MEGLTNGVDVPFFKIAPVRAIVVLDLLYIKIVYPTKLLA